MIRTIIIFSTTDTCPSTILALTLPRQKVESGRIYEKQQKERDLCYEKKKNNNNFPRLKKKKFKIIASSRIVSYVKYSIVFPSRFFLESKRRACVDCVSTSTRFQECYPSRIILSVSCKSTLTSRISLRPARFKSDNTLCKWGYVSEILPSICIKLASNVAKHFHPLSYEHRKRLTMYRGIEIWSIEGRIQRIFPSLFLPSRDLINFIRSNYQCLLSQLLIETMFSFFLYLETTIIIKRKDENIVSGEIFINTLHDSRVLRSAFRKFRSSCFFLSKLTTMSSVSDTSNPWPRFLVTIHSLFTPRYL